MSLYEIMRHLHSAGRWVVLILLLVAIFRSLTAGNRNFNSGDHRVGLLLTIFADIMLLVGLYLYFVSPLGYQLIKDSGMGGVMKNSVSRFFAVEHQVGMLLAIILLHIGKAQGKKNLPHQTKHRRTAIYYIIALLVIIASIPWPIREAGVGRGWLY
ncbi:MAG: hypothetical protein JWP88_704 [Flaviaesturariibacter sp.]|nr:hypothetical protein [Flaviaesturariibacter sp.]